MTKTMRYLVPFLIPVVLFFFVGCAGHTTVAVSTTSLATASYVLFCAEGSIAGSGRSVELVPTSIAITNTQSVSEWARELSDAESISDYPASGYLVQIILIDKNKEPVAWVRILCHQCTVVLKPCYRRGKKYFAYITPTAQRIVRCEPFVRDIYTFMQTHMNVRLDELRNCYAEAGLDLEDMLFKRDVHSRATSKP